MKKRILCLDGGGANSHFDIKLLSFLEEETNQNLFDMFDMVVGVSSSSAIVACIALRIPLKKLEQYHDMFDKNKRSFFTTVYKGEKKTEICRALFGNIKLRDVKKPLVILASSLSGVPVFFNNFENKFSDVELYKAIDASSAVPVYFPPVEIEGELYTDGGLVSNSPLLPAVKKSRDLWGKNVKISMFSIGRSVQHMNSNNIYKKKPRQFGLKTWLSTKLLVQKTEIKHFIDVIAELMFQNCFYRLESGINVNFDDTKEKTKKLLSKHAEYMWESHKHEIIQFLRNHNFI